MLRENEEREKSGGGKSVGCVGVTVCVGVFFFFEIVVKITKN